MRADPQGNPLPTGVHWKHGRYYLVRQNKWMGLDVDYGRSIVLAQSLSKNMDRGLSPYDHLVRFIKRSYVRARNNANGRRKRDFFITEAEVLDLASSGKMRCQVSGTPFSLDKDARTGRRPFAPSIDRIDNSEGYVSGNVRLVCMITNYAMNEWGEDYLRIIARNMTAILRQT